MRKFLVSYRYVNMDSLGFGNAVVNLNEEEKLTPETLNELVEKIKTKNKFKSVVVIAFSEFDKEEA